MIVLAATMFVLGAANTASAQVDEPQTGYNSSNYDYAGDSRDCCYASPQEEMASIVQFEVESFKYRFRELAACTALDMTLNRTRAKAEDRDLSFTMWSALGCKGEGSIYQGSYDKALKEMCADFVEGVTHQGMPESLRYRADYQKVYVSEADKPLLMVYTAVSRTLEAYGCPSR